MRLPKPNIKRPELKMPSLRGRGPSFKGPQVDLPKPVADLYADLRDKRLLPVMGALVVAMIAVPFLFGDSNDSGDAPATASAPPPTASGPGVLTVSAAPDPGLRDYKKRLGGQEKNPFKQQYTDVPQSAQLKSTTSSGGGGDASVSVTETGSGTDVNVDVPSSSGGGGSSGKGGASSQKPPPGINFYAYRPDVLFGVAGSGKLNRHNELPIGTVLPKKQGVAVFLGVTQNGGRALFDISPRVLTVKGGGSCVGGKRNCELLFLREGEAVTLVGASPLPVYRLSVVDIAITEVKEMEKQAKAGSSGVREALSSVQRVRRFSK